MNLLRRLVEALEKLGNIAETQLKQIEKMNNMNEQAFKDRQEWEAVEREHMKVCEQRYLKRIANQEFDEDKPISH